LVIATGLSFPLYILRTLLGKTAATLPNTRPPAPLAPSVAGSGRETLFLAAVQLMLLGAFAVSIGWYWYIGLWLLPRFTVMEIVSQLRQFLEHRGGQLMLIRAGRLERFFLGSYNFHLHGIHHVFPQEPWYSLSTLEQRAVDKRPDMWERQSYVGVLRAFLSGKEAELLAERGVDPIR
jgi:fatty acid desaturase